MEKSNVKSKNRILEIDLLRGIAIIFMIFDHMMYDFGGLLPAFFSNYPNKLFELSNAYWVWEVRIIVRYLIVFIFMGLVGVCGSFSKTNIQRGGRLFGVAMFLTLGTYIFSKINGDYFYHNLITFGTLHCIALSLMFIGLLQKYIQNKWIYLVLGIIMIGLGGYFESVSTIKNLSEYSNYVDVYTVLFGQFIGTIESGGDTMSFLLNGGQVLIGVFIGKTFYEKRESLFKWKYSNNVVTFIGRNSLSVYFLHQIILPVLLSLILIICGYSLAF